MPKTKEIKESWDSIWDNHLKKTSKDDPISSIVYEQMWRIIETYIPKKGIIFDAGCGSGEFSKKLMKVNPCVLSMDLSSVALKNLKEAGGLALVGDVSNLPLKSKSSDAVVSLSVLEYVEDPKRTVMEFERVLNTGGYLVINVCNLISLYTLQRKLRVMFGRYAYYKNLILYSVDSLNELFKGTKFKTELYEYDVLYLNVLNKIFGKEIGGKIISKTRRILPRFLRSFFSHHILYVARKS